MVGSGRSDTNSPLWAPSWASFCIGKIEKKKKSIIENGNSVRLLEQNQYMHILSMCWPLGEISERKPRKFAYFRYFGIEHSIWDARRTDPNLSTENYKIHKIQMYENTFADFFSITEMGQHIQNMQYYDRIIGTIDFLYRFGQFRRKFTTLLSLAASTFAKKKTKNEKITSIHKLDTVQREATQNQYKM